MDGGGPAGGTSQRRKDLNKLSQRRYRERKKAEQGLFDVELTKQQAELEALLEKRRDAEIEVGLLRQQLEQQQDPEWFFPASQAFGKEEVRVRAPYLVLIMACERVISREEVKSWTLKELNNLYKALAETVDCFQPFVPLDDVSSVRARLLKACTLERHGIAAYISANHPFLMQTAKTIRCPPDSKAPSLEEIQQILDSLQLHKSQLDYLRDNANSFEQATAEILTQQASLKALLLDCDIASESWEQYVEDLKGLRHRVVLTGARYHALVWRPNGISFHQEAKLMSATKGNPVDMGRVVELLHERLISSMPFISAASSQIPYAEKADHAEEMSALVNDLNEIRMNDDKPLPVHKRRFS